jgi:hypothetical protein
VEVAEAEVVTEPFRDRNDPDPDESPEDAEVRKRIEAHRAATGPRAAHTVPRPGKLDPYTLAKYFEARAKAQWGAGVCGPANLKALGQQIKSWIGEGLAPQMVAAMIEVYTEMNVGQGPGPAWKDFLYRRQRVLEIVKKQMEQSRVDNYWTRGRERAVAEGRVAE